MLRSILFAFVFTLSIFSIAFYIGCTKEEKDKCTGVTCQNGGSCLEGICYCKGDYVGTHCEKRKCEVNNTSRVKFENKTGTSLTYSVVFDGSIITTLAPGASSEFFTVAAGQHTLHFLIANSGGKEACTESTPVLIQCYDHPFYCTK